MRAVVQLRLWDVFCSFGFRVQSQLGAKHCVHPAKSHLKLGSRMALIDLGGLRTMPQLLGMQLDKGGLEQQSTSSGAAKAASEFCPKSAEEFGILILDKSQMEFGMAARESTCHWS